MTPEEEDFSYNLFKPGFVRLPKGRLDGPQDSEAIKKAVVMANIRERMMEKLRNTQIIKGPFRMEGPIQIKDISEIIEVFLRFDYAQHLQISEWELKAIVKTLAYQLREGLITIYAARAIPGEEDFGV